MFKAHIKLIVLKKLSEESFSGYDLMKEISECGKKPSPGYIYPLLKDLMEKGFISMKKDNRKKIYSITAKGKKLLNDLRKNREAMLRNVSKIWGTIADKKEVEEFIKLKTDMHKNKVCFEDMGLLKRFHKTLFSAYRESAEKKKKAREIIEESIKKMEKLK